MNKYTAYCGLNCETCEARLATVNNDNELSVILCVRFGSAQCQRKLKPARVVVR